MANFKSCCYVLSLLMMSAINGRASDPYQTAYYDNEAVPSTDYYQRRLFPDQSPNTPFEDAFSLRQDEFTPTDGVTAALITVRKKNITKTSKSVSNHDQEI